MVPSLTIRVRPDAVTTLCNERGFSEKDVRSICSVGESSKARATQIGRKGIGCKAGLGLEETPATLNSTTYTSARELLFI